MENQLGSADLIRTASHTSTASAAHKSGAHRSRPSKRTSNASLKSVPSSATDTKSLTSFPSLSPTPDSSPIQSRVSAWVKRDHGLAGENKPASSPDTVKAVISPSFTKGPDLPTVRKVAKSTQQIVGSLVAASPSARERGALFDDTPQEPARIPGNLHRASDDSIKHILERSGPVALVRQLAGDLAQRDAQITALRRKAEERERMLRRILTDCGVSHMDIEIRLRELDPKLSALPTNESQIVQSKKRDDEGLSSAHPEESMDRRIARAVSEDMPEAVDGMGVHSDERTPNADFTSIRSGNVRSTETPRGNWRTFIRSGASAKISRPASIISKPTQEQEVPIHTRSSSTVQQPRKAISDNTFVPPSSEGQEEGVAALKRIHNQAPEPASSPRRSASITNWALRMVAGNSQAKGSDKSTNRGRKSGAASDSVDRAPSIDSVRTSQSAASKNSGTIRARGGRTSLGPSGTIKSVSTEASRSSNATAGAAANQNGQDGHHGPVEMDRILPEDSRPPTLMPPGLARDAEFLTDRFGFIYDQRRKKRQNEATAALAKQKRSSNVESLGDTASALNSLGQDDDAGSIRQDDNGSIQPLSRPSSASSNERPSKSRRAKKWQDYLKLAVHPTELLSHTPAAVPITAVEAPEVPTSPVEPAPRHRQFTLEKRGSFPASSVNSEPSPTRVVSGNAEFASPTALSSSPVNAQPSQPDPVRSLLEQLTELHDSLQREKTVKWNEFLRKVRAERKREGEAAASGEGRPKNLSMPETLLTDGELVGVAGLGNKGKVGRAKWQEFRRLVLDGIPVAYRAKLWAECSGASLLRVPGYYDDLVSNGEDSPAIVAQIQMDITRTLTDNIFFRKGPGVHKLNEVLLAYSRRNPDVGYCQGMNLIAACLLLIMPTAEDAFWVLATMVESILPGKYYDQHLLTSRADQSVLRDYVAELLPQLSAHLDALDIELEALTFQWFLSVFTDCLSAEALFRVWDVVLCMHDGSTFLFQVALALLKLNEKALRECDTPAGVYHYINHQMTNHAISIDGLIQASDALNKVIKRKDVEDRRVRAVAREQDVMRQRDELRRERARQAKAKQRSEPAALSAAGVVPDSASAQTDGTSSLVRSPLSRASKQTDEEQDEIFHQSLEEELRNRTPNPAEEESMWRG